MQKVFQSIFHTPKTVLLAIFLQINSLTWLFIERRIIGIILDGINAALQERFIIWGTWDLAIIISSIIGSIISSKINRLKLLRIWVTFGVFTSTIAHFLRWRNLLLISAVWGIIFGIGLPSCLAYFAKKTTFENRGVLSGLIFSMSSCITPPIILLFKTSDVLSLFSIFWRITGLVAFILLAYEEEGLKIEKMSYSFISILKDKRIALYFIPWLLFSLIYGFQKITIEHSLSTEFYDLLRSIQAVSAVISSILVGRFCDRNGRKIAIIYGFTSLGIAYAILSIFHTGPITFYLYSLIDGIAWGIFIILFVFTLWGDLSSIDTRSADRYYVVGSIPFFLSDFVSSLFAVYLRMEINDAFSVASFFIFLAVVPLLYAPETLPERVIREKELRSYVEKAKRLAEKYS
ncbi:MAG: hypothetical protein QXO15_12630 [Nitrososphaerota archaeon]